MTNKPEKWTLTYNGKKISSKEAWGVYKFGNCEFSYPIEHEQVAFMVCGFLKTGNDSLAHNYCDTLGFRLFCHHANFDSLGIIFTLVKVGRYEEQHCPQTHLPVVTRPSRLSILRELVNNVASSIGNAINNLLGE